MLYEDGRREQFERELERGRAARFADGGASRFTAHTSPRDRESDEPLLRRVLELDELVDLSRAPRTCVLEAKSDAVALRSSFAPVRRELAAGRRGVRVRWILHVVRALDAAPCPSLAIEVRHADVSGEHTSLAGLQFTDGSGTAIFDSIYPGTIEDVATHIDVLVCTSTAELFGARLFFEPTLDARIRGLDAREALGVSRAASHAAPSQPSEASLHFLGAQRDRLFFAATLALL